MKNFSSIILYDFRCLADYVSPRDSGKPDYLGAFVVTAGLGVQLRLRQAVLGRVLERGQAASDVPCQRPLERRLVGSCCWRHFHRQLEFPAGGPNPSSTLQCVHDVVPGRVTLQVLEDGLLLIAADINGQNL